MKLEIALLTSPAMAASKALERAPVQSSLRDLRFSLAFPALRFAPCRAKYIRRSAAMGQEVSLTRARRGAGKCVAPRALE